MTANRSISSIKQSTLQRLQYIELAAYYTGVVTRSDVARAFGISDAAATKDLNFYGQIAPDNLIYKHAVFGFVPAPEFEAVFADLAPARVLPMMAANLAILPEPLGENPLFGIHTENLPLPQRLPEPAVLAQITRAIRGRNKLQVVYSSLTERDSHAPRIIEPHSLVNTGLRWHVRAYSEDTYDFRDFVLARFQEARCLNEGAESSAQYDDDWMEMVALKLTPHPGLNADQRQTLMTDYKARDGVIEVNLRRALIGYALKQLSIDTTADHTLNPNTYPLVLLNRDEIEPFASWAFVSG